jgi:putative DNA primase/helicase
LATRWCRTNEGGRVEGDGEAVAVQALKAADPALEVIVVSRPGWHRLPGLVDPFFVTPGGEVSGTKDDCMLELAAGMRIAEPVTSGTLDGWRAAVEAAVRVTDCPHWTLGLAAGFAGPIVGLTGLDTCGVNLSGISRS